MPSSPSVSNTIFDWLRSEGLNATYCFDLIAEFDEQSPSSFRPSQLGQRASLFFETPGGTRPPNPSPCQGTGAHKHQV
jgi:hypothetical protein